MITKNATYGQTKNVMVCEMGTGDVWMLGSEKGEKGETVLAMKTVAEPRPINVIEKASVETFDEMQPELVFIFNKIESIDSFINMLKDCRAEMLGVTEDGSSVINFLAVHGDHIPRPDEVSDAKSKEDTP